MEDKVLITFSSKNSKKVFDDLKGIARLANAANVAVSAMNKTLMGTKATAGTKSLTSSLVNLDKQQQKVNKGLDDGKKKTDKYHKAQGALRGQNEGMARSFSSMRNALLLYAFATAAVVRSLKGLVQIHLQWESSLFKTEQLLKVTSGASGKTTQDLRDMAVAMGDVTLESAQGVLDASNALLTFKSVSGDVFDRALESASDLAALGFGSVQSAAVQLGKALEDPAIGLASLKRVGVTFSKDQQKSIKLLVKQNQLFTAQKVILGALESQTKGAAKAAAEGLAGAFDSAGEAADNLKRQLGEGGVGQVLESMADGFTKTIGFLQEFEESSNVLSGVVLVAITAITVGLVVLVGVMNHQLSTAILSATANVAFLNTALTTMSTTLGISMKASLGVVGLLVVAIGALTAGALKHRAQEKRRKEAIDASAKSAAEFADKIRRLNEDIEAAPTALGKKVLTTSGLADLTAALESSTGLIKKKIAEQNEAWDKLVKARQEQAGSLKTVALQITGLDYFFDDKGVRKTTTDVNVLNTELVAMIETVAKAKKEVARLNAVLVQVGPSADFEGLVLGIFNADDDTKLRRDIELLQVLIEHLQNVADMNPDANKTFLQLEGLGIDADTIFRVEEMGVSVESLTKALVKLIRSSKFVSGEMKDLFKAAGKFGIDLPEDFTGLGADPNDIMKERQKAILEDQELLNNAREKGLIAQSEGVVLQAELAEKMLQTQESGDVGLELMRGIKLGAARMMQETVSYAEFSAQAVEGLFNVATNALDQLMDGQKVQWKSLFHSMLKDLAQLAMKQALLSAIGSIGASAGPGGFFGSLAAGIATNAGGGTYQAGVPRLVGERGPELEIPSSSGRIVNNTQMNERGLGGGAPAPVVNVNNILDPSMAGDYMDSPDGEVSVLNIMSRNKTAIRAMLR